MSEITNSPIGLEKRHHFVFLAEGVKNLPMFHKKKTGSGKNGAYLRLNLLFYGVLHKKWSFQKQGIIEILGGTKISGKLVKPKY